MRISFSYLKHRFRNASLSAQPILSNHKFTQYQEFVLISPQKKRSLHDTEVIPQEHGRAGGATAMARPTCAGNERSLPAAPRRQLVGGFAERNGGFLGAELLPPKDGNRKTAVFQRRKWTKGKRRGSFSGRGNDRTNIINKHS